MNKVLPAIIALCLSFNIACGADIARDFSSTDEVILVPEETPVQEAGVEENQAEEKTLIEKLKAIREAEYYNYDQKDFLLREVFTHKFPKESKLDYTQFWAGYNGNLGVHFTDDGSVKNHYDFNALNVGIDGVFKNNNADFRLLLGFSPRSHRNFVGSMFSDMYVATNKIPNHRIVAGYTRVPVGKEGGNSAYTLPFLARAQIARNFGTVRKIGTRVMGDYDLIDYDLGVYSSATYFHSFMPGAEFAGWVNFKPLGKTDGKYGKLKIGGGLESGSWHDRYCVTGAYVGYEYKKFMANFEWANADGYNGTAGHVVDNHASGFYTTLGYMLTKKLQILARYDEFDPNKRVKHNNKREFSLGLNYFIKGQALRLIMNYVYCQNDAAKDSHRIMLGTQIML